MENVVDLYPPYAYLGGKRWLYPILNIPEHRVYVEPFGGGLAIFWMKPLVEVNVINDLNPWVYNSWLVIKEWNKLKDEVMRQPWDMLRTSDPRKLRMAMRCFKNEGDRYKLKQFPDVRAFFLFMVRQYWGYNSAEWGLPLRTRKASEKAYEMTMKRFEVYEKYSEKLNHPSVIIRNDDYRSVLSDYKDYSDAWVYLDPPYVQAVKNRYYAVGQYDYGVWPEDLAQEVKKLKGKWAVSYNFSPRVVNAFDGLEGVEIKKVGGIYRLLGTFRWSELLITNYNNPLKRDAV